MPVYGSAHRLEVSVDDSKVVHTVQASSYFCQLLSRRIRGLVELVHENRYQFQPLRVGFVLQVFSKVQTVHILVDEAERVGLRRIRPHEWYCLHIPAAKKGAYVNFIMKPLQGIVSSAFSAECGCNVPRRLERCRISTHSNDRTST